MRNSIRLILRGIVSALRDEHTRALIVLTWTLVLAASLFYSYVEGWRLIDSFYFSTITLATVGYGDFSPKTDLGKLFTVFYIFGGLGLFVAAAAAVAERIVSKSNAKGGDDPDK